MANIWRLPVPAAKMKCRTPWLLMTILACGACALNDTTDPRFQDWLSQTEALCVPRYGALPFNTPEQRAQFEELSYQTYYRDLPREVYADRLRILYPDNRLTVNCFATAFPRW